MKFIIIFDQRSGSTLLSKLITEKLNAIVLPESNFIFNIFKNSCNKKVLFNKLISEKKFKNFKIKDSTLKNIINKNFLDKKKLIDEITKEACKNIYKKRTINIGTKKNQIEYTNKLISLYKKKLKIIFIIRDVRDVFASKKNIYKLNYFKKEFFSTSLIFNSFSWLKNIILIDSIKNNILIIRYEDLISKIDELEKIKKFLKIYKRKNRLIFFQPMEFNKIHKNLKKKIIKSNKNKYINNLNIFEKIILQLFCGSMLYRFNYNKKKNFYYYTSIILYFITKFFLSHKKLLIK